MTRRSSSTSNANTTYKDKDDSVTDPSFANVCVGGTVAVKGSVDDTTVTASKIVVIPPRVRKGAFGQVASVNGVSDPNTCGTAATAGSFTLTGRDNQTFTVNVDTTTTYKDKDESVTDPSFANVCVGDFAAAKGTVDNQIVAATDVFIVPPKQDDSGDQPVHEMRGVFGTVASVNGVSDPNTCGTAGATGSFTLTTWKHDGTETFTVNVDSSTQFFAPGQSDASFADICVGAKVGAKGDVTDTTVAATSAFVLPKFDLESHGRKHHGNCDKTSDPNAQHTAFRGGDDGGWKHGDDVQTVAKNSGSDHHHQDHSGGGWHHGNGR